MQETKPLNLDRASERLSLDGVEGTTTLKTFHGEYPLIKKKKVKFNIQFRGVFPVKKGFFLLKLKSTPQQIKWSVT